MMERSFLIREYIIFISSFLLMLIVHHLMLYFYASIEMYYINFESITNVIFISIFYSFPYIVYRIILLIIKLIKNGLRGITLTIVFRGALKYLLILVLIISIFSIVDIFLFRGFFLLPLLSKSDDISESNHDLSYSIQKTPNSWEFSIKNNSYKFYRIHTIRYVGYNLIFPDSLFFSYTSRPVISIGDAEIGKYPVGGWCLGYKEVLILPKEEIKYTYKSIYSFFNEYHYFELREIDNLPREILVQFYYPIYKLMGNNEINVISNNIEIDTNLLMAILEKKTDELPLIIRPPKRKELLPN